MNESLYRFVAIEGNIGAGKTTLAQSLAQRTGMQFLPEQFEINPFLPGFYSDPERFALPAELFFLEDRYRQVLAATKKHERIISDYLWAKSLVFARINLEGQELQLFERIYTSLSRSLPAPDLVIYLHRPPAVLLQRIEKRGRDFERGISAGYLAKIAAGYHDYIVSEKRIPVIRIEKEYGVDALTEMLLGVMRKRYKPGVLLMP